MIDRIEELLGPLAAEDEEERENVLAQKRGKAVSEGAWTAARASDGAIGPRDRPETEGKRPSDLTALQRDNIAVKPHVSNRQSETTGEGAADWPEPIAGEFWEDGPVWTMQNNAVSEIDETRRTAAAEQGAQTEKAALPAWDEEPVWAGLERVAQGGSMDTAPERVRRSGPARAGLEGLYRQTVQGLRPAAPALPPEQAGRTARAQEPGSAASLTVDELDRAVRRDSRRYDGGMSIY